MTEPQPVPFRLGLFIAGRPAQCTMARLNPGSGVSASCRLGLATQPASLATLCGGGRPCGTGLAMQVVVTWWCTLIGITDPLSIQIASGIVGGSTLIYSPFVPWWLLICPMMRGGRWSPRVHAGLA
jgi:hypothetical protein